MEIITAISKTPRVGGRRLLFRSAGYASYNGFIPNRSYYQAFGYNAAQVSPASQCHGALTPAEVNKVLHAVLPDGTSPADTYPPAAYYSKTRFPCDLGTFRQWVAADLVAMTRNNGGLDCTLGGTQTEDPTGVNNSWKDPTVVSAGFSPAAAPANGTPYAAQGNAGYVLRYQLSQQLQNGVIPDGELCVNFDQYNTPEVIPGKMDKRTANAIFDNIIPGKTWKDASGTVHFLLFGNNGTGTDGAGTYYSARNTNYVRNPVQPFPVANPPFAAGNPPLWYMDPDVTGNGVSDPLWELYSCRLMDAMNIPLNIQTAKTFMFR